MNEDDLSSCTKYALTHSFEPHLRANHLRGVMESTYTELALYGSTIECATTDNVFFTISEVCDGTVSLQEIALPVINLTMLHRFRTF